MLTVASSDPCKVFSLDRLDDVLAAGATRVVVVRAITEADDPAAAARAFTRRLRQRAEVV